MRLEEAELSDDEKRNLQADCFSMDRELEFEGLTYSLAVEVTFLKTLWLYVSGPEVSEQRIKICEFESYRKYRCRLMGYRGRVCVLNHALWVVQVSTGNPRAISLKPVFGLQDYLRCPEISNATTPPTLVASDLFDLGRYGAWNGDLLEREMYTEIYHRADPIAIDASDRVLVGYGKLERYAPDFSRLETFELYSISHIFADERSGMWCVITHTFEPDEYYRVPDREAAGEPAAPE